MRLYAERAKSAGVPPDQFANFTKAGIVLSQKQLEFAAAARMADRADGPNEIGFGGAVGGGKTFCMLAQMGADDCQRHPGIKCLLLRKSGSANRENLNDVRIRAFSKLSHSYAASTGTIVFANGSRIISGHFQAEKDIDKYLGLEYDVIAVEEATTLNAQKYRHISTRNRTSRPGWRPRIYSTTNPGGVGHVWYKHKFITPMKAGKERQMKFVPALPTDNPFNNPEYVPNLQRILSGWERRAWLHGDWDIAAGQYFTSFRLDVHKINSFDDTKAVQWFAALDYGFTHYTVVHLGCEDSDGNVFIVDEHAARGWLPERNAEAIHQMLMRHRLNVRSLARFSCGNDLFAKESTGKTIAQQYADLGIDMTPANVDRINGASEILKLLGDPEAKIPVRLKIHNRCPLLLEQLPEMQHDPKRPEDVLKTDADSNGEGGDDAYDAARMLLATRTHRVTARKLGGL